MSDNLADIVGLMWQTLCALGCRFAPTEDDVDCPIDPMTCPHALHLAYSLDGRKHLGDLCGFDCEPGEEDGYCMIKDRKYSCHVAHLLNELEGKLFGCPYCC